MREHVSRRRFNSMLADCVGGRVSGSKGIAPGGPLKSLAILATLGGLGDFSTRQDD
jgi:hypothetical protein